jgi:Holliday junction resolvase RusA-like endonuclease
MTPEGKAIKEDYAWQAKAQWAGNEMIDEPCGMRVKLFHKTKRKQDIDNYGKLLDSLNRICISDDNLIHELLVSKHHDKENPRIEVEYYELGELTKYEKMDT